jgi:hypothetical protein
MSNILQLLLKMGATSGAGTAYHSGAPEFTPGFNGVRVTRSVVLCVCFVDRCLSFCIFSPIHCVGCSSSIYGLTGKCLRQVEHIRGYL